MFPSGENVGSMMIAPFGKGYGTNFVGAAIAAVVSRIAALDASAKAMIRDMEPIIVRSYHPSMKNASI